MTFAFLIEPPFNDRDATGRVVGHDVEIAKHVLEALGEPFDPIEATFAELLPGLSSARWAMTAGLFATTERRKQALFSRPIWALPDGLLVRRGNPMSFKGYRSIAKSSGARLAVVRDQAQQQSAIAAGISEEAFLVYETYGDAAEAVRNGAADAYASVFQAHSGYLRQNEGLELGAIKVPSDEKPAAPGCFAVAHEYSDFLKRVNAVLDTFIGSEKHREIAARYGFSDADIALLTEG